MSLNQLRTFLLGIGLALGTGTALPGSILGQTSSSPPLDPAIQEPAGAQQSRDVSRAHQFIKNTAAENNMEIALGQLAQLKSGNPQVQQFGKQQAQAHATANQQLNEIAQQQGVDLELSGFMQLTQVAGPQFDQAYVNYLAKEGRMGLQYLQQIANRHSDREIQQFAREQLEQMRNHLQEVERVQAQLQAGGPIREPAGAEPGAQSSTEGAAPQQHFATVLQQRAAGRHYPEGPGTIITEQAGAESQQELMQQVQRLEQQVQDLQGQVKQLQERRDLPAEQSPRRHKGDADLGSMPMPEPREFAEMGAGYSKLCMALSQLAIERSQSPDVRRLAQAQLKSSQEAAQRLAPMAQRHGVAMNTDQMQQLVQATGPQFDEAYLRFVVEEHRRSVTDLRQAADEQGNPGVQQFARLQLPEIEKHLAQALRLQNVIQTAGSIREPAGNQPQQYRDLRELLKP